MTWTEFVVDLILRIIIIIIIIIVLGIAVFCPEREEKGRWRTVDSSFDCTRRIIIITRAQCSDCAVCGVPLCTVHWAVGTGWAWSRGRCRLGILIAGN